MVLYLVLAIYHTRYSTGLAADNNGTVALGAVDETHGSFTRRSTLILAAESRRSQGVIIGVKEAMCSFS